MTLEAALGSFDLADTRFVVISKSGGTPETLVQALAALRRGEGGGPRAARARAVPRHHRAGRRRQGQRPAHAVRGARHPHPRPPPRHRRPLLGASPTSACCRPWRAASMRAPCAPAPATVVDALMAAKSPARLRAGRGRRGRRRRWRASAASASQVMMPYADRLGRFGALVRAAVGREPRQGRPGHGADRLPRPRRPAQPAAALHGRPARAPDQHRARAVGRARARASSPSSRAAAGLDYLAGRTAGDLVAAQAEAVPEALQQAGRPVRTFDLARLDERASGR